MPTKNQSVTLVYFAYDTSAKAYKTGDAANHTLRFVQDGAEATPQNSPAEVDSTNMPGAYELVLVASETNFNVVVLGGASSTANVVLLPATITFDPISNVKKGTGWGGFMVIMTDSVNHIPTPGLTVSVARALDGSGFSTCVNGVIEIGGGAYTTNVSSNDTNGNHVLLQFSAPGADTRYIEVVTDP